MSDEEILSPALADARERLAAAQAKLDARAAGTKLAQAERDTIDQAALAEAILAHGDVGDGIARVGTKAGMVIVKRPTEGRWRQATKDAESREPARQEECAKRLIIDHLVHPTPSEYFLIAEKYPALPGAIIDMISGLARGGARALSGE